MTDQTQVFMNPRGKKLNPRARLAISDGQNERQVEIGQYTSIGRESKNSIQIYDPLVSKAHCLIQFNPDLGFVLRDLESSNGTFVNGQRVHTDRVLAKDDAIKIGSTQLTFIPFESDDARYKMADGTEIVQLKEIRAKIVPSQERFLPEKEIGNEAILRADYEKLRLTYELQRRIGPEHDLDRIFEHILDHTFKFLDCDRAVILTVNETGSLTPHAIKTRKEDERVLISTTLVKKVQTEKVGIITADALADDRFDGAKSIFAQMVRSSMAVPILFENELLGVMIIDSSVSINAYSDKDLSLLTNIANQTAQFIKNREMARKIQMEAVTRERFQRLLSPDLAEMVVSGKLKVEKGGENRTGTVLFADIRDFTAMSENMAAAQVLQMLNEYFELMVETVFPPRGNCGQIRWRYDHGHLGGPRLPRRRPSPRRACRRRHAVRSLRLQPDQDFSRTTAHPHRNRHQYGRTRGRLHRVHANHELFGHRGCRERRIKALFRSQTRPGPHFGRHLEGGFGPFRGNGTGTAACQGKIQARSRFTVSRSPDGTSA